MNAQLTPFEGLAHLTPCLMTNTTAESMPPYSLGRVTGSATVNATDGAPTGSVKHVQVAKPTATGAEVYVSSGAVAIPAGKTGPGFMGTLLPVTATASSTGDTFKPVANAWTVEDGAGRLVQLMAKGSLVLFQQVAPALSRVRGTATADFAAGVSITINSLTGIDGNAGTLTSPLTVHNVFNREGEAGETIVAEWNVTNGQWEESGGGGSGSENWIDFLATGSMNTATSPHSFNATVSRAEGSLVAVSTAVIITDPIEQFGDIIDGCQGKAKWNAVQARWEVINSTRPKNDRWVILTSELKVTDATATVEAVVEDWCGPPYTVEEDMIGVTVDNPHRLEAIDGPDSYVRIQRRNSGTNKWFITETTKKMPRVLFGVLYNAPADDGAGSITADVDITLELEGSMPEDAEGYAITRVTGKAQIYDTRVTPTHAVLGWTGGQSVCLRYRPEDQTYYFIGTESSFLGRAHQRNVPVSVALDANHDIITKNRDLYVAGGWDDPETDVLAIDMALNFLVNGVQANATTNSWDISRVQAWLPYTEPDAGYSISGDQCTT